MLSEIVNKVVCAGFVVECISCLRVGVCACFSSHSCRIQSQTHTKRLMLSWTREGSEHSLSNIYVGHAACDLDYLGFKSSLP